MVCLVSDGAADKNDFIPGKTVGVVGVGNEPYLIGGEAVADRLSFYDRSGYALGTATCLDMRLGC